MGLSLRPKQTTDRWRSGVLGALTAALVALPGVATAPAVPAGEFSPASTSWTSPDRGWVLGWRPCGDDLCPHLLRTTDGGETWIEAGVPDLQVPEGGDEVRVFFAERGDHTFGVITTGEELYVSRDDGRTWHSRDLGVDRIGAVDATAFHVYVAGLSEGGSGVRTQYFRTPVLTERWEPLRELAAAGPGTAASTQTDLASDGWVLQASTATFDGLNRVWTSRLPGRLVDASPCESLASTHVGVADVRRQFVLCSSNPGMGYMDKELQVTTDGGKTFEPVATAPRDGLTSDFAVADSETIAIGATAGDAGIVAASFDGGASWEFTLFEPETGPVTDLDYQDAEHGTLVAGQAALGTSQLFRTVDGGHTWQPVDVTVG